MTFMIDVGYRWMDSKAAIRTVQQLEDCKSVLCRNAAANGRS